jgi:multisubunit Na+/H+ antiporter MnhF subunit
MIAVALVILCIAAGAFLVRLLIGPTVPDRIVALDGLLITITCGILTAAAYRGASVSLDTALVVVLVGFVGTGIVARYVEKRGG